MAGYQKQVHWHSSGGYSWQVFKVRDENDKSLHWRSADGRAPTKEQANKDADKLVAFLDSCDRADAYARTEGPL